MTAQANLKICYKVSRLEAVKATSRSGSVFRADLAFCFVSVCVDFSLMGRGLALKTTG